MTAWTQPGFEAIARVVSQRAGLSFALRQDSAEHGMRRGMLRAKMHDPGQYADLLAGDDVVFDDLIGELTVGETYFFREPNHFQFIEQQILPDVRTRRGVLPVRVWSAACATGEEPYSLAMLFDRCGMINTHLMATDIARGALLKARQAIYGAWSLRGDSALAARRYLTQVGKDYRLDERIRRRVTFASLNLALDAYPSFAAGIWGMDLILCRNVLIYFDRASVRRTAERLHATLADGGWLITASSDPPLWEYAPFEVVTVADGLFYRRAGVGAAVILRPAPIAADWPEPAPCGIIAARRQEAPLDEARPAQAERDQAHAVSLTANFEEDEESALRQVRALAQRDTPAAIAACVNAVAQHRLSAELHFLHAALLLDADRTPEAVEALRRVLYLDRSLAIAHFTLGVALSRCGETAGACRAYRNARDLSAARPPDEPVPLADGETAGRLAAIASAELALQKKNEV